MTKSVSNAKRLRIYARDGNVCQYCGKDLDNFEMMIDHVIPQSYGGTHEEENLKVVCNHCNTSKGNRTLEYFRLHLCIQKSQYFGIIAAHQMLKLIDLGIHFPDVPLHSFYFEQG